MIPIWQNISYEFSSRPTFETTAVETQISFSGRPENITCDPITIKVHRHFYDSPSLWFVTTKPAIFVNYCIATEDLEEAKIRALQEVEKYFRRVADVLRVRLEKMT
jgi:hypothetical protein